MILSENQQFASPGEALEHHGVKGMKWGVRQKSETVTVNNKTKQVSVKKAAKLDKKFEKKVNSTDAFFELHNGAADHVNAHLPALNEKFDKKYPKEMNDGTLWNSDHPVTREYHKAYNDLFTEGLNNTAAKMGTNATGTRRIVVKTKNHESAEDFDWTWGTAKVQHSVDDETLIFEVTRDKNGVIIKVELPKTPESIAQTIERGSAFLEHHGIKGMKWGVRKERETAGKGTVGIDPVTAAIGAAYVGLFLAGTYKTIRDIRRYRNDSGEKIQKQNANVPWKKNANLAKKAPPMTVDSLQSQVVKQVNPDFPKAGTKMNCRRATFTYEMRRRGYDVTATKSHFAIGQDLEGLQTATMSGKKKYYESVWGEKQVAPPHEFARQTPEHKSQMIFDSIGKNPNGARGELAVGWQFGGGHSMAYEIVNNKPVIFDAQSGVTYRTPESFKKFATITHDAAHTRTDNVTLDESYLRRWMVNV